MRLSIRKWQCCKLAALFCESKNLRSLSVVLLYDYLEQSRVGRINTKIVSNYAEVYVDIFNDGLPKLLIWTWWFYFIWLFVSIFFFFIPRHFHFLMFKHRLLCSHSICNQIDLTFLFFLEWMQQISCWFVIFSGYLPIYQLFCLLHFADKKNKIKYISETVTLTLKHFN